MTMYQTPDIETLRKKYIGESNNEAAGCGDDFWAGVRSRAETDTAFRDMIKASMEEARDKTVWRKDANGYWEVLDRDGKVIAVQG